MIEHQIETTNYENDPSRNERLHRVLGYVFCYDQYNCTDIYENILGLHDHKGTLLVLWKKDIPHTFRKIVVDAWNSIIGDGCGENVHHIIQQHIDWQDMAPKYEGYE